jgi:hypothetical protein
VKSRFHFNDIYTEDISIKKEKNYMYIEPMKAKTGFRMSLLRTANRVFTALGFKKPRDPNNDPTLRRNMWLETRNPPPIPPQDPTLRDNMWLEKRMTPSVRSATLSHLFGQYDRWFGSISRHLMLEKMLTPSVRSATLSTLFGQYDRWFGVISQHLG